MKITFFSHSTYMIEIHGIFLLVDPFFYGNPLFKKDSKLLNRCIKYFKRIDYILLTHAHYDHVCDTELFANKFGSLVISNYEISNFFEKKKLKTYGINYGSFISFPFGRLKYVWATHSSVFDDGTYGGNPGGFLLQTKDKKNIYLSGDTSLTYEMKLIPSFGTLKISILPIGGVYTMGVEEAIIASDFLQCKKVLGVHYDTFEAIKIDKKKAKEKFYEKNKELFLLKIGDTMCI
ncbi:metal-dependent hydrolase [Blattabacterium cuenoti]|uniref:metal-dependent hydrolase n=1 Tax=Blattabacterium cuenoti TaxID=1653831 RepID=UPI00163C1963|nr:metal-dependent hydrolase [Blattabacterium cuenoti]